MVFDRRRSVGFRDDLGEPCAGINKDHVFGAAPPQSTRPCSLPEKPTSVDSIGSAATARSRSPASPALSTGGVNGMENGKWKMENFFGAWGNPEKTRPGDRSRRHLRVVIKGLACGNAQAWRARFRGMRAKGRPARRDFADICRARSRPAAPACHRP